MQCPVYTCLAEQRVTATTCWHYLFQTVRSTYEYLWAWVTRQGQNLFVIKASKLFIWESFINIWATPSEFVSSSIPSWQILTAHAQPFRGARDLAFYLKVPPDSLLVWASSGGSGETARMCRLAWTFAARIGDKYQIRLTRSIYKNIKMILISSPFRLIRHYTICLKLFIKTPLFCWTF